MSDEFAVGDRVVFSRNPGRWAEKDDVSMTGTIVDYDWLFMLIRPDEAICETNPLVARRITQVHKAPECTA